MTSLNTKTIRTAKTKSEFQAIETAIHQSWINDVDKIEDYELYLNTISAILSHDKIEDYFTQDKIEEDGTIALVADIDSLDYFTNRFAKESIASMLKQQYVLGPSGDEIVFCIIKCYIKLFIKHFTNANLPACYFNLFESLKEIFDAQRSYYRAGFIPKSKDGSVIDAETLRLKQITSETYNEDILERKKEVNIVEGSEVDVCILFETKKIGVGFTNYNQFGVLNMIESISFNYFFEKKFWTRGTVSSIQEDELVVITGEEDKAKSYRIGGFDYTLAGQMTKDFDFRTNLEKWDIVLCQERNKLHPATVIGIDKKIVNGYPAIYYKLGFRLYIHQNSRYKEEQLIALAKKYWPEKTETLDLNNEVYIGDKPDLDESIHYGSKRIIQLEYLENMDALESEIPTIPIQDVLKQVFFIDDLIEYEIRKLNIDGNETVSYNPIVGRSRAFSFYYVRLLRFLIENDYIKEMINYFDKSKNSKVNPDITLYLIHILSEITLHFHKDFIQNEIAPQFVSNVVNYLSSLSTDEIRTIKKESVNSLMKILKFFQNFLDSSNFQLVDIDNFALDFSIKLIQTPILDKRIAALKSIVEIIKSKKKNQASSRKEITEIITKNNLFDEIFGVNSHTQLINKSKELLEVLAIERLLTVDQLEHVWKATQKGDIVNKTTIVKILTDLNSILSFEFKEILIAKLYGSSTELTSEELFLLSELVRSCFNESKNLEHVLIFVINMIERRIECQDEDKGKGYDRRIFFWVSKYLTIKEQVIAYILKKLGFLTQTSDKSTDRRFVAQKLRILNFLIKDQLEFTEDERRIYILISKESLSSFINQIAGLIKPESVFNSSSMKIDNKPLKENIDLRLNFIITLIDKGIWGFSSQYKENPLNFFHGVLFSRSVEVVPEFQHAFYSLCSSILKISELESSFHFLQLQDNTEVQEQTVNHERIKYIHLIEDSLISILNEKALAKDKISDLTEEAFQVYTELFFRINKRKNLLSFERGEGEIWQYNDIYLLNYPDNLDNFGQLWNIILYSKEANVMNRGIRILTHLFHCITWENGSEMLLIKALDMIKEHSNNIHVISKCLSILKLIVMDSESSFSSNNFGVISHNSLTGSRKLVKLRIINHVRNLVDFDLHISSNSTMVELKKVIATKVDMHTDFLEFHFSSYVNNKYSLFHLRPETNGSTIEEMGFNTRTEIKVFSNKLEEKIPQADLVQTIYNDENKPVRVEITEQVLNILQSWFLEYSTSEADDINKMYKEDCAKFMQAVTNVRDPILPDSYKVMSLFNEYDKENLGYITEESFVNFFRLSTINAEKRKVVWENMKNMGVRNDLRKISEPFYTHDCEKNPGAVKELPRLKLGNNDNLFFTIFDMLKSSQSDCGSSILESEVSLFERWKTANDFICFVCSNAKMLNNVINNNSEFMKQSLENKNSSVYEISYLISLIKLIVDSVSSETVVREENQCKCGNTSCRNNQYILSVADRCPISKEEIKRWFNQFIKDDGVSLLIKLLLARMNKFCQLTEYIQFLDQNSSLKGSANQLVEAEKMLIQNLFKLIRSFYFTSLKATNEVYRLVNKLDHDDGPLQNNNELAIQVLVSFNFTVIYKHLLQNLIDYIRLDKSLQDSQDGSASNPDMISELFEFLAGIICYSNPDELSVIQEKLISSQDFSECFAYGLFSSNSELREKYQETITKTLQALEMNKNNKVLTYIYNQLIYLFETRCYDSTYKCYEEFFSIICELLSRYYASTHLFDVDQSANDELITKVIEQSIKQLLGDSDKINNHHISDYLSSFISIISVVSRYQKNLKADLTEKYDLISVILNNVLFEEDKLSSIDSLDANDLVDVNEILKLNSKKGENQKLKAACYKLINSLLQDNVENMIKFFSLDIFMKDTSQNKVHAEEEDILPKKYMRNVEPASLVKFNKHVGLYNLGAICYANSILQQFFMIKPFRYNLLKASDTDPIFATKDENHFHQLQRMFSFLELSSRQYYNPIYFCYSFKDWELMPINTAIQSDCQEFISRLIDKMEESLKPTAYKYLFSSIFSGKICSSITCDTCKTTRFKFEDLYTLSLGIAGVSNIYDAIDRYTQEEKIDNFSCEKCQKKVTISKRNLLSELPNTLIIHLQRINFNYETEKNIKINTKLEFPKELNLKRFCVEEVLNSSKNLNEKKTDDEEVNEENDDIYHKCDEYYEYNLQGTTVHWGSADSGHYFSYINTERDGNINSPDFDYKDENKAKSWLEFNDKNIRKFDFNNLEQECFGGKQNNSNNEIGGYASMMMKMDNSQSAYVLFYERKLKSPLKYVISVDQLDNNMSNVIRVEENQRSAIHKSFNAARVYNSEGSNEAYISILDKLSQTVFYDVASEEYYKYINFYDSARQLMMKKCYFEEIIKDNSSFLKQQSVSDIAFIEFYTNIIVSMKTSIDSIIAHSSVNQKIKVNIVSNISSFLINILAESNSKEIGKYLKKVLDALLKISEKDKNILQLTIFKLKGEFPQIKKFILNDSAEIIEYFCDFLLQIFRLLISNFGQNQVSGDSEDSHKAPLKHFEILLFPFIDKIIEIFPKVPNKYVPKISGLIKLLYSMVNDPSEVFITYFLKQQKELPFLLVTYLIGKDSPHYNATITKKGERWDFSRPALSNIDLITGIIMKFYKDYRPELTERDIDCICSIPFLKLVMKKNKEIFTTLAVELNENNYEFTKEFCRDICKQIEDIAYNDEDALINIIKTIVPVLAIRDEYQQERFCNIIGYPQLKFDQVYNGHYFPTFGYHILSSKTTKMVEYKSNLRDRNHTSILKKFSFMASREKASIEIFLALIQASSMNVDILKYIYKMPFEEPYYNDLFDYGIVLLKTSANLGYISRMSEIVTKLNNEMIPQLDDLNILNGFSGFYSDQIPGDVKMEEYSLIYEKDNVFIIQVDYYATIVKYESSIDFKSSISYIDKTNFSRKDSVDSNQEEAPKCLAYETEDIQKYRDQQSSIIIDLSLKPTLEREFLNGFLKDLLLQRKLQVITSKVVGDFYHTTTRIIAYNNSKIDTSISFKALIPNRDQPFNEFLPSGSIDIPVISNTIKNILVISKIRLDKPFSFDIKDMKYEISINKSDQSSHQFNYQYNLAPYRDNRYGQISSNNDGVDSDDDEDTRMLFSG